MPDRRFLPLREALEWYPQWSQSDRTRIQSELERLAVLRCYEPPSRGYIGCLDVAGRVVMYLAPGYVAFKKSTAPESLGGDTWFALSTFRSRSASVNFEVDDAEFCPIHHYQLPATGRCDLCDE